MPDINLSGEFVLNNKEKINSDKTSSNMHEDKKKNMHFYSSLGHYPKNFVFQNQEENEEVILVIRRDFITNLPWILGILLSVLLPPILLFLAPFFFPFLNISNILIVLSIAFYYLVIFGFAILYFSIWYFNVGIVTNKRIVDIDVPNILVRHISEVRLFAIVDVSYSQVGGIRSYFDYGNLEVQTEGFVQNVEFDRAPNPNFIRKVIGELIVNNPGA